jgi:hypothetical protein
VLERLHGLMPGTTASVLGAVNSVLPRGASPEAKPGPAVREEIRMPFFDQLTGFGSSAAQRFSQTPADSSSRARSTERRAA